MAVDKVPAIIFDALEKNDFYILPQKEFDPLIGLRAKQVLSRKQPDLAGLQKLLNSNNATGFTK